MKNIQHPTSNIQRPIAMHLCDNSMFGVGCWALNVPKSVLILAIRVYRWTVSPMQVFLFGPAGGCRFTLTCSEYAMAAVRARGAIAGGWLAVKRICRCHPWGKGGHDPVPECGMRNAAYGNILEHTH